MSESNIWAAWTLAGHDALTAAAEEALPAGLGMRDLAALTLVGSHDGCSADWLWGRLGLTQSGTVRLIDRLERLGYLVRARSGRVLRLSLTEAGAQTVESWSEARDRAAGEVLGSLSPSERRQLNHLLSTALRRHHRARQTADITCRLCAWPTCAPCPVDESVS